MPAALVLSMHHLAAWAVEASSGHVPGGAMPYGMQGPPGRLHA